MKTIYAVLFLFIFSSCTSWTQVTTSKVNNVIEVSGTKNELFINANEWMVRTFKDAKSVIQFQDKEAGKIMGKYLMHSYTTGTDVYSLITIEVRDNATKIDVEPLGSWYYDNSGMTVYNYSPEQAKKDIMQLLDEYKAYMSKGKESW